MPEHREHDARAEMRHAADGPEWADRPARQGAHFRRHPPPMPLRPWAVASRDAEIERGIRPYLRRHVAYHKLYRLGLLCH